MKEERLQHFILTRFNLSLWKKNKKGTKIRTKKWLAHRFSVFERYCLPSVKNQTCKGFEWIVLFDSMTPGPFKAKINDWKRDFPQMVPVFVDPENGWRYAEIFRGQIIARLSSKLKFEDNQNNRVRVLTTYLDNDDALNVGYIEDLQKRVSTLEDETFIYYDDGYQFFADYKYMLQIYYPRNHFVSYVENGNPATIKSVFGFGGHYYIYTIKGAKIEHVRNMHMWCEVLHEENMANDAYFLLKAKMMRDENMMRCLFAVDETVKYGWGIYFRRFLPRYAKTFCRRTKWFLCGGIV